MNRTELQKSLQRRLADHTAEKIRGKVTCPDCNKQHEYNGIDECAAAVLISIVAQRGETSAKRLREIFTKLNADALWEDLGPVIDNLERGDYSK